MPVTKLINAKATVKQFTNNDLPVQGNSPVLASFAAVSTAGQSIINLPFTIIASGLNANIDSLWVFVDGKKLVYGAANDYTLTSLAADGSSAQVTLNYPIPANFNVQVYKMGFQLGSSFASDNRFVSLYSTLGTSFQGFVDTTTALIAPTTVTGTPSAGLFYSTITGRASISDLSQDLKPRMGIERIAVQQVQELQNEFGPSGERVFSAINDDKGLVRFVGNWISLVNVHGPYVTSALGATTDYAEITFYGTGLNLIASTPAATHTYLAAVDGGSETTVFNVATAGVPSGRNYTTNSIIPISTGLTLGIHTIKIRCTSGGFDFEGFELLNDSSSVKVAPGSSYINGQKLTSSALSSFVYNASPVTGTRGGRVLVYQASDGTIGKAFQATNASQANMTSADHTNEEVIRAYSPREFGAGRLPGTPDDFSLILDASTNAAFTLDDGTTTLVGAGVRVGFLGGSQERVYTATGTGNFITITFVGTGLDITILNNASTGKNYNTILVDGGASIGSITPVSNETKTYKIVSGLPYGTHTVKFTGNASDVGTPIIKFIVYGPKKPALPTGAVELGDYNVMANYSAGTAALGTVSGGALRKFAAREMIYTSTGWTSPGPSINTAYNGGWIFPGTGANNGQDVRYLSFFGTGVEYHGSFTSGSTYNQVISVDGITNLSSLGTATLVTTGTTGVTLTGATGVLSGTAATATGLFMVSITGLTLGFHKIVVAQNAGTTDGINLDCFDIITPIHSAKSNLFADIQNTLLVGSNAISDNRQITPTKGVAPTQKAWAQAVGNTSSPTTTSTSFVPMPDMSLTIKTTGNPIEIYYAAMVQNSNAGDFTLLVPYVDGVGVSNGKFSDSATAGNRQDVSESLIVPVAAGVHKVDLYWEVSANTATSNSTRRILKAREI